MGAMAKTHRSSNWTAIANGGVGHRGAFGAVRSLVNDHPFTADAVLAVGLLTLATLWLVRSGAATTETALLLVGLIIPLAWRRARPDVVFVIIALVAFAQWMLEVRLEADLSLLIALYTIAVHGSRPLIVWSAFLAEIGVVLASVRWSVAGTEPRSIVFLSGLVVAALCAGFAVRSGSQYLVWMEERADRLELERDQRATIAAAEERARIAREMHDIIAHSLSVVVTLADAASVTGVSDPERAVATMRQASEVGRQALQDMRTMLSALRTEDAKLDLGPQPGVDDLSELYERVRQTGMQVDATIVGDPFPLSATLGLSVYRIVQEALTNVIKHSNASSVRIRLEYRATAIGLTVDDDGSTNFSPPLARVEVTDGHGLTGMAERASLHGGTVSAGPSPNGGWSVITSLESGQLSAAERCL